MCADFPALSDFLAEKPLVMGKERITLDATAYGYIGNFLQPC
ncbi:glutathione S-transferase C-terminal domain-containing protein [Microcoleus sp. S13C4]